ncbi:energy transducer TonB [Luteimonas sp. RD2P54]|uniref:Energy transducer TonB n=1 Tax=Luteimonas endophytica TaxID=3042023 RepID=A0ABT6J8C2_9GAMM|nr:energy transducer TonB [Luteimonas endophytica]MDH5823077.1 energy transducer TonB [Luteimonas endophytica]
MRAWLLLSLLVLLSPAFAQDAPRSVDLWLGAEVTIDTDGRIASLEWKEQSDTDRIVIDQIEPIVRSWEFVPGTVDGVPAVTRTGLSLRTRIVEGGDAISVYIEDASTGASTTSMHPPSYPGAALRDRVSAEVIAEIEIAADGAVVLVGTRFEGSRDTLHRRQFLRAAEDAVRDWEFTLEEVGGHPVATRMSVPITFCVDPSGWCRQRERAAAMRPVAPGQALALESAVSLKSDPRTGI